MIKSHIKKNNITHSWKRLKGNHFSNSYYQSTKEQSSPLQFKYLLVFKINSCEHNIEFKNIEKILALSPVLCSAKKCSGRKSRREKKVGKRKGGGDG